MAEHPHHTLPPPIACPARLLSGSISSKRGQGCGSLPTDSAWWDEPPTMSLAYRVEELLALRDSVSESAVSMDKFADEDVIKGRSLTGYIPVHRSPFTVTLSKTNSDLILCPCPQPRSYLTFTKTKDLLTSLSYRTRPAPFCLRICTSTLQNFE